MVRRTDEVLELAVLLLAGPQVVAPASSAEPQRFVLLERHLLPPLDVRGRPWRVEVLRSDPAVPEEPIASANADRDGGWRHARVPSGSPVRLRVRTEDRDVWWVSPLPFAPDGDEREGTIDLGMVPILGVARVGKQPLPGEVIFTHESGAVVRFVSDISGELEGALPRPGTWMTRVRSVAAAFDRSLEVDVPEPEPDAPSFVDIHFPDPALRGEVVDEKGIPVDGFTLAIREVGDPAETLEKIEGSTFRYERIAPGHYDVRVSAPGKGSPRYRVHVPHDDDPDYVKAVLEPRNEFRGRVVSTTGAPVPGGVGWLAPSPSGGWDARQVHPRGARAAFQGTLPESAERACLFLYPEGHAVSISMRPATDEEQEIVVSSVGGTIVLEYPLIPYRPGTLFRNGCPLHAGILALQRGAEREDHGSYNRVVSPPMEPGAYSLCIVALAEAASFPGGVPAFPRCVHGILAPGGRLELDLVTGQPDGAP